MPGGKIDFGEPAKVATAREISEELGITITIGEIACLTETIGADDGQHWVAPVYHATIATGTPMLMEPDKHGGWNWFALDDLPDALTTPTQQFLASLRS